mmetsp:Transcript_79819/g.205331  ORF Transcript_79819/g.205331 Transcript_79819/m.205331 type:complete len:309 (-) Transcript_79819:513-1439(-)
MRGADPLAPIVRVVVEHLLRQEADKGATGCGEHALHEAIHGIDVREGCPRDDVAEHLVVAEHAPRDDRAHDEEVDAEEQYIVIPALALPQAIEEDRQEWNGGPDGDLHHRLHSVVWKPVGHAVKDPTEHKGAACRCRIEARPDRRGLRVGEARKLKPHSEVAERHPRDRAKDTLRNDDDEGWRLEDPPHQRHALHEGRELGSTLLLLSGRLRHAQPDRDANCGAQQGDHVEDELPAEKAANRVRGKHGRDGCECSIAGVARELNHAKREAATPGWGLVGHKAEHQRPNEPEPNAVDEPAGQQEIEVGR